MGRILRRISGRTYRTPIALRAADLVGGHGQGVDGRAGHVDRDPARGRGGVDVQQGAALVADRGHLADRLDGADLAVHPGDRGHPGVEVELVGEPGQVDHAVGPDRHGPDADAAPAQRAGDRQRRLVVGGAEHRVDRGAVVVAERAEQRDVVALGRAGGEHDAGRVGAEEPRDGLGGPVHRPAGTLAQQVRGTTGCRNPPRRYGSIASSTSSSTRVVAQLSRYMTSIVSALSSGRC